MTVYKLDFLGRSFHSLVPLTLSPQENSVDGVSLQISQVGLLVCLQANQIGPASSLSSK